MTQFSSQFPWTLVLPVKWGYGSFRAMVKNWSLVTALGSNYIETECTHISSLLKRNDLYLSLNVELIGCSLHFGQIIWPLRLSFSVLLIMYLFFSICPLLSKMFSLCSSFYSWDNLNSSMTPIARSSRQEEKEPLFMFSNSGYSVGSLVWVSAILTFEEKGASRSNWLLVFGC